MKNSFTNDLIEKMFLKKILSSEEYNLIFSETFDRRWFDNKNIAVTIDLALKFYSKYQKIPTAAIMKAILEKYAEQPKKANDNFNVGEAVSLIYEMDKFLTDVPNEVYQDEIGNFVKNKGLLFAISDNIEDIERLGNVEKCLARFEKIQKIEFDTDIGMNYFQELEEHFNRDIMNPEAKLPTLFEGLDHITEGGFLRHGKSLYLFMAQAGLGKSVLLSNLALNFLTQNLTVVVISLEMSEAVYAQRFDAHLSGDNINRLNETKNSSLSKIQAFYQKYPNAQLFIKEYPPNTITALTIDNYLEKLKRKGIVPDVVIVDYLGLLKTSVKNSKDSSYFEGKDISEQLRALSYKYSVPFISAVQSNSEGIDNEQISMKNVAESRAITHTADFLGALMQIGEEDVSNGIIRLKILKNRLGGRVGSQLMFRMNRESLRLADVSIISAKVDEPMDTEYADNTDLEIPTLPTNQALKDLD